MISFWVLSLSITLLLVILTKTTHTPGVATAPGFAAIDKGNKRVVLAQADLPPQGATLRITTITLFIRASAVNTQAASLIAAAEKNGSTGRIVFLVNDQNITSIAAAQARANSELVLKSQANASVNIVTRLDGFKAKDKIRFIDEIAEIDFKLQIMNINRTLETTDPTIKRDNWVYTLAASLYTTEVQKLLALAVRLSTNPQEPIQVRIQGIDD